MRKSFAPTLLRFWEPQPSPRFSFVDADYRVAIDVQTFESSPGDAATLSAMWSVRRVKDGKTQIGRDGRARGLLGQSLSSPRRGSQPRTRPLERGHCGPYSRLDVSACNSAWFRCVPVALCDALEGGSCDSARLTRHVELLAALVATEVVNPLLAEATSNATHCVHRSVRPGMRCGVSRLVPYQTPPRWSAIDSRRRH